jgi:hypothetical protein
MIDHHQADAQLLALLRKFEPIYDEYRVLAPIVGAAVRRREQEIARRTGIPAHVGFRSEAEAALHLEEWKRVDTEMPCTNALIKQLEAVDVRLDPIIDAIQATPARTLAGVAVKARAAAYTIEECWRKPQDELDWQETVLRDLIEGVCALAGVDLPRLAGSKSHHRNLSS